MSANISGNTPPPPNYDSTGGTTGSSDSTGTQGSSGDLAPSKFGALEGSGHHFNNVSTTSTDELETTQTDSGVDLNTQSTNTSGSTWGSTVGKTVGQGTTVLPSPASDGTGAVPHDIAGNPWFSNSGYIMAHLATLQQESINENMALEIGLQGADALKAQMQANIDNANLTKEEWDKQADIAKWQMISAGVSLGITVGSMAASVGAGAAGGVIKGGGFFKPKPTGETSLAEKPPVEASKSLGEKAPDETNPDSPKSKWSWSGFGAGAMDGARLAGNFMAPISQAGGSVGQMMTSAATMRDDREIGLIKQGEIESQAAADMLKNAVQTCNQEAHDALERNDGFRQFIKSVDDNRLQYSSRFTPG